MCLHAGEAHLIGRIGDLADVRLCNRNGAIEGPAESPRGRSCKDRHGRGVRETHRANTLFYKCREDDNGHDNHDDDGDFVSESDEAKQMQASTYQ